MAIHRSVATALFLTALATSASAQGNGRIDNDNQGRQRGRDGTGRFHPMDADRDDVITKAEWQGNDESFRRQDTNADGVLSGAEVSRLPRSGNTVRRRDDLVAQFTRADADNNNRLGRDEWSTPLGSFDQSDANNDGTVTRAEFLAATRVRQGNDTDFIDTDASRDRALDTPAYKAGVQNGLIDGRQAGKEDRQVNGAKWDLEGQRELEQADAGYQTTLGPRGEYQSGYRNGFRRGYAEGFGPR